MDHKNVEKNDYITNRVLTFFGGTAALLWVISYLKRGFSYHSSYKIAQVAALVLIAVGLAGAAYGVARFLRQSRDGSVKTAVLTGTIIAWFSLLLAFGAAMMRFFDYTVAMRLLYIIMPASAILYLIFCTYPREFFTMATTHSCVAMLLWFIGQASELPVRPTLKFVSFAVGLLLCGGTLALYLATRKKGGVLSVGPLQLRLFGPRVKASYPVAVYSATVALLLVAVLFGSPVAYYAMFAVAAFLFASVVYYTVRMF